MHCPEKGDDVRTTGQMQKVRHDGFIWKQERYAGDPSKVGTRKFPYDRIDDSAAYTLVLVQEAIDD